jgi:hypothetical protein
VHGIILKSILNGHSVRPGPSTGPCEHGSDLSVFIKAGEFLDQLNYYQLNKFMTTVTQLSQLTDTKCDPQ